jgi:hypothetical protein
VEVVQKAKEVENNLHLREYLDYQKPSNNNIDSKKIEKQIAINKGENRWERFGGHPPFSYLNNENAEDDVIKSNVRMKNIVK